jgi:hypothetical protein
MAPSPRTAPGRAAASQRGQGAREAAGADGVTRGCRAAWPRRPREGRRWRDHPKAYRPAGPRADKNAPRGRGPRSLYAGPARAATAPPRPGGHRRGRQRPGAEREPRLRAEERLGLRLEAGGLPDGRPHVGAQHLRRGDQLPHILQLYGADDRRPSQGEAANVAPPRGNPLDRARGGREDGQEA